VSLAHRKLCRYYNYRNENEVSNLPVKCKFQVLRFFPATRKDAKATVKLYEVGTGKVTVNGKSMLDYFQHDHHIERLVG
jgi:hypothetical protein